MPFDPNSATLVSEPERGFDPSTARPVSDEPESRYDPSVGMGDYLLNQARKGVTFSANLATAIGQTIDDPDTSFVTTDPVTGKMDRVVSADESAWDGFWRNYERASKLSASVVEADLAMKPPSMTGEVLGGAVEAMADPVNLATGGLLKPTIQAGIAGFGASGGGIAGRTIDPENEYYGETIGTLTGGFAGMGKGLVVGTATQDVTGDARKMRDLWKGKDSRGVEGAVAKKLLERISQEQGIDNLQALADDLQNAGHLIDKDSMPILFALSSSPSARQEVMRLAKTRPEFMQYVNNELSGITMKIDDWYRTNIGQHSARVGHPSTYTSQQNKTINNARKRIDGIDQAILTTEQKLDTGIEGAELGRRMTALLKQKKDAIKAELSPAYTQLRQEAEIAGAVMPPESVNSIYQFVTQTKVRDLFGKGTALDNKIMGYLSPKQVSVKGDMPSDPMRLGIGGDTTVMKTKMPELTFDQVDSLKREINRIKRGNLSDADARLLGQLDAVVANARESIPGDFNQRLKALDELYYKRIGIPFEDAKGVKQAMHPKKFSQEIAPYIIKDAEKLQQFIDVAGNEGIELARQAVQAQIYSGIKDGVVSPKAIKAYLAKNREVVSRIPNLRKEMELMARDQSNLMLSMGRMKDAVVEQEKIIANSFLSQVSGTTRIPDYQSLASGLINKTSRVDEVLRSIKTLAPNEAKAVRGSLRRAIIDIAQGQPNSFEFLSSPKNTKVIEAVMGKQHYKNIKYLAKMSDIAKKADVSKAAHAVTGEEPVKVLGIDITKWLALVRRPILSPQQKAAIGVSQVWTAGRQDAVDKSLMLALKDPDGLNKLVAIAEGASGGMGNMTHAAKSRFITALAEIAPIYAYTTGKEEFSDQQPVEPNFRATTSEVNP